MTEQIRKDTVNQIKQDQTDISSQYPEFVKSVHNVFPNSMLMSQYFYLANEVTTKLGFNDENTVCIYRYNVHYLLNVYINIIHLISNIMNRWEWQLFVAMKLQSLP